jgi:hypothetical protein
MDSMPPPLLPEPRGRSHLSGIRRDFHRAARVPQIIALGSRQQLPDQFSACAGQHRACIVSEPELWAAGGGIGALLFGWIVELFQ